MRNERWLLLMVPVIGCSNPSPERRDIASPEEPGPTTKVTADNEPDAEPKTDPKKRRADLEKRLHVAIEVDGHPQGWQMVEAISDCKAGGSTPRNALELDRHVKCAGTITKVQGISQTCFHGGQALRFLRDGDLDTAEAKVVETEALAKEWGPKRKRAMAEQKATLAAAEECHPDSTPCKTRCDQKNDLPACIAHGVALYETKKKYADARIYLKKGCDADYGPACNLLKDVDKVEAEEKKNAGAAIESAWSNVKSVGDDLATKKFLHRVASQNFKGARNARATANMAIHIQALTKDYCVAAKEFFTVSTRAELAKRAKGHCADDPPTATGLGGTEETLTADCTQVYATACP